MNACLCAAHCLRPSRQRAYQMTDPHNKKSSSSGPGQDRSELISMYDSQTWPETRRSETFHSQAAKLWEFVTEELVSKPSVAFPSSHLHP